MRLSRFFIDRPIFAVVLSVVITLAGLMSMRLLPLSEYPEVVPPTIQVTAVYPGASPETIAALRRAIGSSRRGSRPKSPTR
jgi:multidrug efflux pump